MASISFYYQVLTLFCDELSICLLNKSAVNWQFQCFFIQCEELPKIADIQARCSNQPSSHVYQFCSEFYSAFYLSECDNVIRGCQRVKLPEQIKCQLALPPPIIIFPPHMSKYRNVFQKQQPIHLIKPNNQSSALNISQPTHDPKKQTQSPPLLQKSIKSSKVQKSRISVDKVSLVFSRIHNAFNLKFQTLCLGVQLYSKCCEQKQNPQQSAIPNGYLMLISIYLAMKYEEIYYPRLKNILSFIPVKLNLQEYMRYQTIVFEKMGSSLNCRTAKTMLQQLFKGCNQETYFFAHYLLEIALQDKSIVSEFQTELICKCIFYSMLPLSATKKVLRQFKGVPMEVINECSKLLIQKKSKHTEAESALFKKYSQERYMKVAQKPYFQIKQSQLE